MPSLAGALTSLGLLALPSVPSPAYFAAQAGSDTWSISITDSGAVEAATPPVEKSASDGWSLTLSEGASSIQTYPAELTQLSPLALPGKYVAVTVKSVVSDLTVEVSDAWLLGWTETPINLVELDLWDVWGLRFTESLSLSITQTFAADETWSFSWNDVGTVFAGGPISPSVSDTWSLQIADGATVAATVSATDTWELEFTDSASVAVTQDAKSGTDTWSLNFELETGFVGVVSEIPIISSDEWRIAISERSSLISLSLDVPARRRIKVEGPSRNNKVE